MKTKDVQMSESYLIGAFLAVTGGFLDAYTYILRGHVFSNAQTGNMVLMAIKLSESKFKEAGIYLIPIASFAVGVIISEYIRKKITADHWLHWRQIIVLLEFCILLSAAFIPVGSMNGIVNILVSFACSMQVEAFRKVNGNAYATTMCTGNLRSASEHFYRSVVYNDKSALNKSFQYLGIILIFIFGAFFGSIIINLYGEASVLSCCILLMIVFFLMFKHREGTEN